MIAIFLIGVFLAMSPCTGPTLDTKFDSCVCNGNGFATTVCTGTEEECRKFKDECFKICRDRTKETVVRQKV